jgi:hypothetical protein
LPTLCVAFQESLLVYIRVIGLKFTLFNGI